MVKNPIMDSERYCDFRTDYQESVRMKRQVNQFRRKAAGWNLRAFLKKKLYRIEYPRGSCTNKNSERSSIFHAVNSFHYSRCYAIVIVW
jgi:hypothetical protein